MPKTSNVKNTKPTARRRQQPGLKIPTQGMLSELVGYHLRRAQQRVFEDFTAAIGGYGITPGQFGVLVLIEANTGLNQSELGLAMGVDRSTVVAIVDRLEGNNLISRHPVLGDRRAYALGLTAQGKSVLAKLKVRVRQHDRRIAQKLSARQQAQFITMLNQIA